MYNVQQMYQSRLQALITQFQLGSSESYLSQNNNSEARCNKPVPKLDGNRPSIFNRRISSEQTELPDGKVCTRVPARRWSKVRLLKLRDHERLVSLYREIRIGTPFSSNVNIAPCLETFESIDERQNLCATRRCIFQNKRANLNVLCVLIRRQGACFIACVAS